MNKRAALLCFGELHWRNGLERNQSIVKNLIEADLFDRGIYIEPSYWFSSMLGDVSQLRRYLYGPKKVLDGRITIKRIVHFMPLKYKFNFLKKTEEFAIRQVLISSLKSTEYVLYINKIALDLEDVLVDLIEKAKFSFFDFSDDFREFSGTNSDRVLFDSFVEKIIPKMDFVIHVNDHVKERYSHLNTNNIVIRNATNYENFDRSSFNIIEVMENIRLKYTCIVGCIGTCNFIRLDLAAITALVSIKKNLAFVFIGNIDQKVRECLKSFPNIYYIDFVPYDVLPDYLNYFDVCTAPMLINDHTAGNDLLKLHDYLAMGKPVVASAIGGANDLEHVTIYDTPASFVIKVLEGLSNNNADLVAARKKNAYENSWGFRLRPLKGYLANLIVHGSRS